MTRLFGYRAPVGLAALLVASFVIIAGIGSASAQPVSPDEGLRVFKSANCVGCHKWTGEGGGGYGGAAANLRRTKLSLEQIEETVRCGRPMTGMPHFEADAYTDGHCFGLKKAEMPESSIPPEPDHPLRPADIKTVATYVVTWIKGKGDPDDAQCQAFFGTGSRACNTYPKGGEGQMASTSAGPDASGGHMKVDQATDANAPGGTL